MHRFNTSDEHIAQAEAQLEAAEQANDVDAIEALGSLLLDCQTAQLAECLAEDFPTRAEAEAELAAMSDEEYAAAWERFGDLCERGIGETYRYYRVFLR